MPTLEAFVNDDASHVSRKVFTSSELYHLEKQKIFTKNWIYLTHESQIPEKGDYVLAYIGETSVIVARGSDDKVYASINSCSHRGLPVARADRGNVKRFICPYHSWSFDLEGNLSAAPQERKLSQTLDKNNLGLKKIPRVESYCGLVFGCLDEGVISLDSYLGNMRWYIDCLFDRSGGGAQVIGAPHKWLIKCNWKLPVENQLGDVAHGPFLHGAMLKDSPQIQEIEEVGFNVVPEPGHGVSVRLLQEGLDADAYLAGTDGFTSFDKEVMEYMRSQQAEVEQRLGKIRARVKPLCYSVYPNLSFLWSNSTLRISHPRSPGETEYWSWWVVDKDMPNSVKEKLQQNYTFFFGPGGFLEQEDSEAWSQQYIGASADYTDDRSLYYGLGLDEEKPHPDLPGLVGSVYNEHYARAFYKRWRKDLTVPVLETEL